MARAGTRLGRWWWLAAAPLAAALWAAGPMAERGALALALAAALAGVLMGRRGEPGATIVWAALSGALLLAATMSLAAHLLSDDFAYHYVRLYSAESLAWPYKLANLWGGDEGTLLLLALFAAASASHLGRHGGWAGSGALAVAALFALGALLWNPFTQVPPQELAALEGRGMNAHLISIWMLFHPPFVFIAYVLLLAPAGAALEALASGQGAWDGIAGRYVRAGWLVLSGGLALGMWWAYEDFTFGQFWHWDPVQTSIFVVWALATAHLHCLRRFRIGGAFARIHPLLGLLTGIAVLCSLGVARSPALASSHRYVGETSLPVFLAGAGLLAGLSAWALVRSWRRPVAPGHHSSEYGVLIWISVAAFSAAALIAAGHLVEAYLSAYLGRPRPDTLKPFFETLARWSAPAELAQLRAAFAQWEVDNFALNRWLAPLGSVVFLFAGQALLPLRRHWLRWSITALVALAAALTALLLEPAGRLFDGGGVTSRSTVALFPWLDALAVAAAYLALSALAWMIVAVVRRHGRPALYRFYTPLGLVHLGAVMAVAAATAALVFDGYAQRIIDYPEDFGAPLRFPGGYAVTVALEGESSAPDGARGGGFNAIAKVGWSLEREGRVLESRQGHAVYRDDRAPLTGGRNPVRLMCEMLDYRYARFASDTTQMIHPFIHRGLWRDVQIWFPAVAYDAQAAAPGSPQLAALRRPSQAPVVLKVYPLVTWLWLGLGLVMAGAAARTLDELRHLRRRAARRRQGP
jgi:cytochrome c-type biogenesis protein CcmF